MSVFALGLVLVLAGAAVGFGLTQRRRARTLARRLEHSAQELERLQTAFARFAPEAVVDEIAARGGSPAARECEVTVLVADPKRFTAMSEIMAPEGVGEVLNGIFG